MLDKKRKKILIRISIILGVGLPLFLVLMLQLIIFQTYLANTVAQNFSSKMGGKVVFERVYLSPFSGINIKNMYVEDDRQDTLLFIESLVVDIGTLDIANSRFQIQELSLENGFYNLYSINAREQTNMQYIIDYFSSSEQKTSTGNFYLDVEQLTVSGLRFKYLSFKPDTLDYGVNFKNIDIPRLDLEANTFSLVNDSMNFNLEALVLQEQSGFQVDNLTADVTVSSKIIRLLNTVVKTPSSHIFASECSLKYNEWADMANFLDKVNLKLNLQLSALNISDIAYFAPIFKMVDLPTFAQGEIHGKISNLKSKKILLTLGDASRIETSFSMAGLPKIEETFLNLGIKRMNLDMHDLEQLLVHQKEEQYSLPEFFKRVGFIHYKGDVTGFLTDLVAYGAFDNDKGKLNTDLRFKFDKDRKTYAFSGKVNTVDLDLSTLMALDTLFDKVSMSGMLVAEIDSADNIKGHLKGDISSIGIKQYNYKNISFNADLNRLILNSQIVINDTNLIANLDSRIDFSLQEPSFDFTGRLHKARVSAINWVDRDISSRLSFKVKAQFTSLDLDKFFGEFTVDSLRYFEKEKAIYSNSIHLKSTTNEGKRSVFVYSDLFDARFEGHFKTQDLLQHFFKIAHSQLPSFFDFKKKKKLPRQDINFDINLKNTYSVFSIFSPSFLMANRTQLKGNFVSEESRFNLHLKTDSCRINDNLALDIDANINGNIQELSSDLLIKKMYVAHELSFKHVHLKNTLSSDSLNIYLSWLDDSLKQESAELLSELIFYPSQFDSINFDLNLIPSYLFIEDSIWYINDAKIAVRGNRTFIDKLIINNDQQYLYVDGIWQEEQSDSLQVLLNKIDLAYFPYLDRKTNLKMRALVDGDIVLSYKGKQPFISGYIQADTLKINDRLLGNLSINTEWKPETEQLFLTLVNKLGRKQFESIKSEGYIDFKNSKIDLDLALNKQKLSFFNPFVEPYLSNLKGYLSGDLNIKGPFDKIEYIGDLDFARAGLTYDYLGTRYNFTDHIKIEKNKFIFDTMKVFQIDGLGDYAVVNGYIQHNNFTNFQFFIDIEANDFMVLNTTFRDNELYYGTAFLTGIIEFTGNQDNLDIKISAETNKNTRFYIPLSDAEEASGSNFISFVGEEERELKVKDDYKLDVSGIILDFDLKVTPEAEVQLIFDSRLGDVVKANGSGNLNMNINTRGNFTMSGNYVIEKGDYLFTLQNIINKKFKIESGSSIKWNGDPYQAFVDIDAIYRLKTPLYDLTLNEEDKERVPVECRLKMEQSLTSPEITFDIKLPSSNDQAKSLISAMDQEEKNIQLLSLMILNKFYTPDYLRGGEEIGSGNAVGKNASELLSNQLSGWLSQMSDDFDIGVNYRPGDEISNDELEVALSTQLFNNRVAVDGNIGVGDYQNTNSNVVGNVNVDVKINKKGNIRVRGFNRANENEMENSSLYTQGVGLYFKEDFDSFGELLNKYWKIITFDTDSKDTHK